MGAGSPIFGRDWLSRETGKSLLQFEGMRKWGVCVCVSGPLIIDPSAGIKSFCCENIFGEFDS